MVNELKPCPLCGKHPHHGLGKLQHCQLHGEPFQNFRIWCTAGHAQVEEASRELAFTAWNTRADTGRLSEMEAEVARLRSALGKFTKARLLKGVDGCDGWALSILADAYQEARAALEAQS